MFATNGASSSVDLRVLRSALEDILPQNESDLSSMKCWAAATPFGAGVNIIVPVLKMFHSLIFFM